MGRICQTRSASPGAVPMRAASSFCSALTTPSCRWPLDQASSHAGDVCAGCERLSTRRSGRAPPKEPTSEGGALQVCPRRSPCAADCRLAGLTRVSSGRDASGLRQRTTDACLLWASRGWIHEQVETPRSHDRPPPHRPAETRRGGVSEEVHWTRTPRNGWPEGLRGCVEGIYGNVGRDDMKNGLSQDIMRFHWTAFCVQWTAIAACHIVGRE